MSGIWLVKWRNTITKSTGYWKNEYTEEEARRKVEVRNSFSYHNSYYLTYAAVKKGSDEDESK